MIGVLLACFSIVVAVGTLGKNIVTLIDCIGKAKKSKKEKDS
jgi:hypothetical protein